MAEETSTTYYESLALADTSSLSEDWATDALHRRLNRYERQVLRELRRFGKMKLPSFYSYSMVVSAVALGCSVFATVSRARGATDERLPFVIMGGYSVATLILASSGAALGLISWRYMFEPLRCAHPAVARRTTLDSAFVGQLALTARTTLTGAAQWLRWEVETVERRKKIVFGVFDRVGGVPVLLAGAAAQFQSLVHVQWAWLAYLAFLLTAMDFALERMMTVYRRFALLLEQAVELQSKRGEGGSSGTIPSRSATT